MPDFAHPFKANVGTKDDGRGLIQAVRLDIAGELEANLSL